MVRNVGTDREGRSFSEAVVRAVWEKTPDAPITGLLGGSQGLIAKATREKSLRGLVGDFVGESFPDSKSDICGTPMKFSDYGNRDSEYGWEIDHIRPVALGGQDDISNLQALHWRNNQAKSDQFPWP